MKEYTKPEIVVSEIKTEDVILASGGLVATKFNVNQKGFSEVQF